MEILDRFAGSFQRLRARPIPATRKATTSRKRRCDVSQYQLVPVIILIINQGRKKKFSKKRNERKEKGRESGDETWFP